MTFIGAVIFSLGLLFMGPSPLLSDMFEKSIALTTVGITVMAVGVSFVVTPWPLAFTTLLTRKFDNSLESTDHFESVSWV